MKKPSLPRSMTGFGASRVEAKGLGISVEIRAVNHRFLQVKTRLPHEISALEQSLEALLRTRVARGSVMVRVDLENLAGKGASLDRNRARSYCKELRALATDLDLSQDVDLATLISLPGVMAPPTGVDPKDVWPLLKKTLVQALDRLDTMRFAEGEALVLDLTGRTKKLTALMSKVTRRSPKAVKTAQTKLKDRVSDLVGSKLAKEDLAREVALLAEKQDVSEEINRFSSHLSQWGTIMDKGGQMGKRLEFLLQEMGREVNTIGSKANDATLAHLVVELKGELEKQREQIQNLE